MQQYPNEDNLFHGVVKNQQGSPCAWRVVDPGFAYEFGALYVEGMREPSEFHGFIAKIFLRGSEWHVLYKDTSLIVDNLPDAFRIAQNWVMYGESRMSNDNLPWRRHHEFLSLVNGATKL